MADYIDIVFAKSDDPNPDFRFVEVEDANGASAEVGEWLQREDGYWALRVPMTLQWQSIETAPKDREIWAFNGDQARMLWSEGPDWALWVWADALLSDTDPSPDQPTHWMDLPVPPTKESA